jgi:hypothetical protein
MTTCRSLLRDDQHGEEVVEENATKEGLESIMDAKNAGFKLSDFIDK